MIPYCPLTQIRIAILLQINIVMSTMSAPVYGLIFVYVSYNKLAVSVLRSYNLTRQ
jgi:hypothetical protein